MCVVHFALTLELWTGLAGIAYEQYDQYQSLPQ